MTRQALVVDDEPMNQLVLGTMLKRMGYEVRHAGDGQIGINLFRAGPQPDVVFVDVQMPNIDGYECMRLMRAWEQEQGLARTPMIAVTPKLLEDVDADILAAGADSLLLKPIMMDLLKDALERLVKP